MEMRTAILITTFLTIAIVIPYISSYYGGMAGTMSLIKKSEGVAYKVGDDNYITFRMNKEGKASLYTITHESAHVMWSTILTKEQKAEWKLIHYTSTQFVSSYAKTNEREDFAESYTYRQLYNTTLEPMKEEFLVSKLGLVN